MPPGLECPHRRRRWRRSVTDEANATTSKIPDRNAPPQTALANASDSAPSQTWKISTITRNDVSADGHPDYAPQRHAGDPSPRPCGLETGRS